MEYVQMTLDDWVSMKQKLKQELLGVKQSFVRIGYALRKIEDQRLYEQDGYKSIAEFAKAEYGLEPSTTSRFMSINREYSIDGYSETLRPEFSELGRSQLEEMLKLPDSDRQMIQPETSREDIRELKRFNKTEPAAGVADDIHQLVETFYKDNPEILNAVFSKPGFEEQNIKQFAEIVNPGGNRSYKKGLYFLMMYESRVAVKKFGANPQDMTWWQFYQITMDIFEQAAAGAKTWQRYFGGEDSEEEQEMERNVPADDAEPDERTGGAGGDNSGSGAGDGIDHTQPVSADRERPEEEQDTGAAGQAEDEKIDEPEADSGTDGENGAEDEPVDQKGAVGDHGAISDRGTGEAENDTAGEESGKSDCKGAAERETAEQTGEESQGEEIAPAQKTAEILEREASGDAENKEIMNAPEVIDKPFGTRKDYMDTLTAYGMAIYIAQEYERHSLKASSLAFPSELEKWLLEEVDDSGQKIAEA